MTDLASLGIRIETAEVKSGAKDLDQLTAAAGRTETAVEKLGPAAAAAGRDLAAIGNGSRTLGPGLANQARQFQAAGISAKQYSAALRTVPAQITDIVTGLASGQNPFLVAIQQGGQLRDQFGGFGNALGALRTIVTPTRIALAGLGGIAAALALSFKAGQEESAALANAIVVGGNAAGVTTSQQRELAKSIDAIAGTEGQAANALALLTASGKVAGDNLRELAEVAVLAERSLGTPIEETAKQFADLGRDPVNALKKLNDQFNFLTAATLKQVSALVEQGRQFEAGTVAQDAFKDRLREISKEAETNLGTLQRLGRGVVEVFREARNALLNIGRSQTSQGALDETLKDIQGIQDILDKSGGLNSTDRAFLQQRLADRRAFAEALKEDIQKENRLADQQAANAAARRSALDEEIKASAKRKELAAAGEQLRKARLGSEISDIKRSLDAQQQLFANQESRLDLLRQAGLIKDAEFFERKRQLIEDSTAAQVAAKEAENQKLRAQQTAGVAEIERQRIIKDNEAEIMRLRTAAAAQLGDLSIEQEAANLKLERSYIEAKAAADQFLKSLELQFQRQQQLAGLGDKARDRQGQRDDLEDRFQGQRDQVQGEFRRNEITKEELDRQLALIDDTSAKAAAAIERNFAAIDAQSTDFLLGAREAFANYIDEATNVAQQSEDLFSNAFRGAEDALVQFATTGKLNFKDLANSILQDLIRIQIRALIVRAVGGLFGGAGGGGAAVAARAAGGPIESGRPYLVGERGPELVIPRSSGTVVPARQTAMMLSGRGAPNVTINQSFVQSAGSDPAAEFQRMEQIKRETVQATRAAIAQDLARGRFDGALQGAQR